MAENAKSLKSALSGEWAFDDGASVLAAGLWTALLCEPLEKCYLAFARHQVMLNETRTALLHAVALLLIAELQTASEMLRAGSLASSSVVSPRRDSTRDQNAPRPDSLADQTFFSTFRRFRFTGLSLSR